VTSPSSTRSPRRLARRRLARRRHARRRHARRRLRSCAALPLPRRLRCDASRRDAARARRLARLRLAPRRLAREAVRLRPAPRAAVDRCEDITNL
jgi:hypothetical protein